MVLRRGQGGASPLRLPHTTMVLRRGIVRNGTYKTLQKILVLCRRPGGACPALFATKHYSLASQPGAGQGLWVETLDFDAYATPGAVALWNLHSLTRLSN